MHLYGHGLRGVLQQFHTHVFWRGHKRLLRIGLFHFQPQRLDAFQRRGHAFDVKSKMIHLRSYGASHRVILAENDEYAGKLHHGSGPVGHDFAAQHGEEFFLRRNVFHRQMKMAHGYAGGVGRGQLRQ